LVCGYASASAGIISVHRGNLDAFAPQSQQSFQAIANGQFPDPFLPDATLLEAPEQPDFLASGDFDRDGNLDILAGARGGEALYLFAGNGKGGFSAAQKIMLPGKLSALTSGEIDTPDGYADLVVGVSSEAGPQIVVYEGPRGVMADDPLIYSLNAE